MLPEGNIRNYHINTHNFLSKYLLTKITEVKLNADGINGINAHIEEEVHNSNVALFIRYSHIAVDNQYMKYK